jgi:pimeloyl-ACP methyl ester carboxylesterase
MNSGKLPFQTIKAFHKLKICTVGGLPEHIALPKRFQLLKLNEAGFNRQVMKKLLALLLVAVSVLQTGCLKRYVFTLNDEQIQQRFANKPVKPKFNYLNYDGYKIHYATIGDSTKPLLVLVHGAPGTWYSSLKLMTDSALLTEFFILSFDRFGYNKSAYGQKSIVTIDGHVDYLQALVTEANFSKQPITIVGRSFGAPIAARYAMRYPAQVAKLMMWGSCIDPKYEKFFWFSYANKLGFVNNFTPRNLNVTTYEKFNHKRALRLIENDWENITAPTYVLHGTKDWIASIRNAYFAQRKIVNAPVYLNIAEGAGHNVSRTHFDLIRSLLMK